MKLFQGTAWLGVFLMTSLNGSAANPEGSQSIAIEIDSVTVSVGSTAVVPVTIDQKIDKALGLQFGLSWDPGEVELVEVWSDSIPHFSTSAHASASVGRLAVLWDDPELKGLSLEAGEALVMLRFRVGGADEGYSLINLDYDVLKPIVVFENSSNVFQQVSESIPEIRRPEINAVSINFSGGGELILRVPSRDGFQYRIEASPSLVDPIWRIVGEFQGDGSHHDISDRQANRSTGFYRIIEY